MQRLLTILIFTFSLTGMMMAQSKWFWQMPQPQGNDLYDVQVIETESGMSRTVIAVGGTGTVIKTTNNGLNWQVTPNVAEISENLFDVAFINSTTGWTVGEKGKIIKTTDGGANWTLQNSGTVFNLYSACFTDLNHGIAVGRWGTIIKTENGGVNWEEVESGTLRLLRAVFLVDDSTGWAAGHGGTIIHTSDGGTTWQAQTSNIDQHLRAVYFDDSQNGWVVGDNGTVMKTENGGIDWVLMQTSNSTRLKSLSFISADSGLAVGCSVTEFEGETYENQGILLKTIDGGHSWTPIEIDLMPPLNRIQLIDSENGCIVGDGGIILKISNFGDQQTSPNKILGLSPFSAFFIDENQGWITGQGSASRTLDGGNNWETVNVYAENPATEAFYDLWDIQFANPDTGWIVGYSYAVENGQFIPKSGIFKTTDGGLNWQSQRERAYEITLRACFLNSTTGWAVGANGLILKTVDGGNTWNTQPKTSNSVLFSVCFIDSNLGWAVGDGGRIIKTVNGGSQWRNKGWITSNALFSVDFVDSLHGWVVGDLGTVLHSADGGETWAQQTQMTTSLLFSVCFLDTLNGITVGANGTILYTKDGGKKWESMASGTKKTLTSVVIVDENIGYITGDGGIVLKTTTGFTSIEKINSRQPQLVKQVQLEQNFPNPFNSTTTIRFHLAKSEKISLKIYNVLGELVQTVLDGDLPAGEHELQFQAEGLSSGLYFCRLQTGNQAITRRFVFQK